jgi:hypothetical protein
MTRIAFAFALVLAANAPADDKPIELVGTVGGRGLPMAECDNNVQGIKLTFQLNAKGEGAGTLTLDATPNPVDEYGFPVTMKAEPPVKLECALKRVGTKKMLAEGPPGVPANEVEWELYEVTGPKIVSKLSLARQAEAGWPHARFIWATKEGKNRTLVGLSDPNPVPVPPPPPPCHPGCFPAGTKVQVPGGARAIEDLRAGDTITTVGPDGKPGEAKVAAMFLTKNKLVEIEAEGRTLISTATQPLAVADGKIRPAGELKAGDRIFVWAKGERGTATVKSVTATDRTAPVYNVVLGDTALFVAGGFVARTKPPAPVVP